MDTILYPIESAANSPAEGGKAEEVPAEKDMSLKRATTYVKDPLLGDIWRSYAIFIDTPHPNS